MTREEAIRNINALNAVCGQKPFYDNEFEKALDMAVEALEQEPCKDCISRQAVLNILQDYVFEEDEIESVTDECQNNMAESIARNIVQLPSVTPQELKTGHWITDAETYYKAINERGNRVDEYTPYFTDDIACSECLAKYSVLDNETQFFKHCPNCGSKNE